MSTYRRRYREVGWQGDSLRVIYPPDGVVLHWVGYTPSYATYRDGAGKQVLLLPPALVYVRDYMPAEGDGAEPLPTSPDPDLIGEIG